MPSLFTAGSLAQSAAGTWVGRGKGRPWHIIAKAVQSITRVAIGMRCSLMEVLPRALIAWGWIANRMLAVAVIEIIPVDVPPDLT